MITSYLPVCHRVTHGKLNKLFSFFLFHFVRQLTYYLLPENSSPTPCLLLEYSCTRWIYIGTNVPSVLVEFLSSTLCPTNAILVSTALSMPLGGKPFLIPIFSHHIDIEIITINWLFDYTLPTCMYLLHLHDATGWNAYSSSYLLLLNKTSYWYHN
jgi:hypothetical protein